MRRLGGATLIGLAVATLQVGAASAATKTWTGTAGDHKFTTAGNWNPSGAPSNGDDLVFPVTATDNVPNNDAVGLSVLSVTFNGSGAGNVNISGNALTVTGSISASVSGAGYFGFISAPLTVTGPQTWTANANNTIVIDGVMSGSGAITKAGVGGLFLGADNPGYTAALVVNAGYLMMDHAGSLGDTGAGTTISSGASLVTCYSVGLTIAEPITIGGTGDGAHGAIHVMDGCNGGGNNGSITTFSGALTLTANTTTDGTLQGVAKFTGALSGSYTIGVAPGSGTSLVLAGSSNTTLTPNGTYTAAPTTVTVAQSDSQPSLAVSVGANNTYIIDGVRGDTNVLSGGTLMGSGTVGNLNVLTGGIVAPGHSPGCLSTGSIVLNGTYQAEIGGTTACTGYDQLVVTGTVDVTGATLAVSLYNGFKPAAGQTYTIINNDASDAVTGTFNGLAQGATFTVNGYVFKISYTGGDGNDVVLSVVSVPSVPGTGLAMIKTLSPVLVSLLGLLAAVSLLWVAKRYASNN